MSTIEEVKEALNDVNGSMRIVNTFMHGRGVQVYRKTRKVGPLMLPAEGESLGDVLRTLGDLADTPTTPSHQPIEETKA